MRQYDSYKDSGVEWIGKIPSHWESKKGKFIFNILYGFPFDAHKFDNATGFPLIRIRDITSGKIETYFNGEYNESYIIKEGDLLVGMDGDFNVRLWKGEDALLNQRCCKIEGKDLVSTKFIYYCLPDVLKMINDLAYATTVKHLLNGDILNLQLPIPPFNEQKLISFYLDTQTTRIDSIIKAREEKIKLLEELKTTIISKAVTQGIDKNVETRDSGIEWIGKIPKHWEVKKIKYSFDIYAGATPKTEKKEFWDGDIIWITPADYKTFDKYIYRGARNISQLGYKSCNTQIVPSGSLIISKRAPIGTVAISSVPLCTNQGCLSCVPYNANVIYFYYCASVFTNLFDLYGSGTTFKEISSASFANIKLPCPPLSEQVRIANYLEKATSDIWGKIEKAQQEISLLKEYRSSLISEVVTGKRKVTD